jgi:GxxExxY protein
LREIEFQRQVEVVYKGKIIKGQRLDLLVENEVIVEIKSLSRLPEAATAQIFVLSKSDRLETRVVNKFRRGDANSRR